MPEFMILLCDVEGEKNKLPPEEVRAHYERISAWWTEHEKAGRFIPAVQRRLQGTNKAKTVRVKGGKAIVSDGPFAETKEQIGGFYLIDVADLDSALEWARKLPLRPDWAAEVRPVMDYEAAGGSAAHVSEEVAS